MTFTRETDYALRLVLAFSALDPGEYDTAQQVSAAQGIPYRFLLRVLKKLKKAGIVASRQGSDGGYRLARSSGTISLWDVIEAIEGGIDICRCLGDISFCNAGKAPECVIHRTMRSVQDNLISDLKSFTFDDLRGAPPRGEP